MTRKAAPLLLIALALQLSTRADTVYERDFNALREQRDRALAAASEPINRRYRESLEQLLRKATQASDLDTALKIKKELNATADHALPASAPPAIKAPTPPIIKPTEAAAKAAALLHGTTWKPSKGPKTSIEFDADKNSLRVFWADGSSGGYEFTVDHRTVKWHPGGKPIQKLEFAYDWKSFDWNGSKLHPVDKP